MIRRKEYVFEFPGTKAEFLRKLEPIPGRTYYTGNYIYLDEYIVAQEEGHIRFGVARGGHSGGYWFIPEITEYEDRLELRGTITYIGPGSRRSPAGQLCDKIEMFLLTILFLPVLLIVKLYTLTEWTVRKLLNRPKPREKTEADGLYDLMENHLGCKEIRR